jgi:glyoxylase-like metal-dependent hydrolase (beta-lactamase superfamily II)
MDPDPARPQTNEPVSVNVLNGNKATVLFGTGFKSSVDQLISYLDDLGGVDVIVVEHADPDHYYALPDLLEEYDARVAIPEEGAQTLEDDIGVTPDVELGQDEEHWGVRTIHIPGHTPDNMSFIHEPTETLFVGDTFAHKNSFVAESDDWSGQFAMIKSQLNADDELARENVAMLSDYDFKNALITHGLNVLGDADVELRKLIDDLGVGSR